MAQVNIKAAAITNATSMPRVQNSRGIEGGELVRAVNGLCAITSGDTQAATYAAGASVYRFGYIKSSDFYDQLRVICPDIGTTTAIDIGLYAVGNATAPGAVVDQDFFASALALNAGALAETGTAGLSAFQSFEAGAAGGLATNLNKRVWEALGLTSDPGLTYEVVGTLTGAADGTGTVSVRIYVVR